MSLEDHIEHTVLLIDEYLEVVTGTEGDPDQTLEALIKNLEKSFLRLSGTQIAGLHACVIFTSLAELALDGRIKQESADQVTRSSVTQQVSLKEVRIQCAALSVLCICLTKTDDPIGWLESSPKAAQNSVLILFQELMTERIIENSSDFSIENYKIHFPFRLIRLRHALFILTQCAALAQEHPAIANVIKPHNALIPVIFDLVKLLLSRAPSRYGSGFVSFLEDICLGDLTFLKELV